MVPTTEQAKALKKAGIAYPFLWSVVREYDELLLIKHCLTGEFRAIEK